MTVAYFKAWDICIFLENWKIITKDLRRNSKCLR
jgi:hypothetical protein